MNDYMGIDVSKARLDVHARAADRDEAFSNDEAGIAALVAYARATELMSGHAGSWHGLAWTMLLLEDLVEAERLLDHALEVDRNFAETHGALGVVYARTCRRTSANSPPPA